MQSLEKHYIINIFYWTVWNCNLAFNNNNKNKHCDENSWRFSSKATTSEKNNTIFKDFQIKDLETPSLLKRFALPIPKKNSSEFQMTDYLVQKINQNIKAV